MWAVLFAGLGYVSVDMLSPLLRRLHEPTSWLIGCAAVLAAAGMLLFWRRRLRRRDRPAEEQ